MGSPVEVTSSANVSSVLRVGVLAVQGDFAEHRYHLQEAFTSENLPEGHGKLLEVVEVKKPEHLDDLKGLIIPGGESTTIGHFLQRDRFREKLGAWIRGSCGDRLPVVWGTCAGLILLADKVTDQKDGGQCTLGGINVTACRNMYGRQQASFEAPLCLHDEKLSKGDAVCYGVFIRAPGVTSVDSNLVQILATHTDPQGRQTPVAVEQDNIIASSFHPELTDDLRWHEYFLGKICTQDS